MYKNISKQNRILSCFLVVLMTIVFLCSNAFVAEAKTTKIDFSNIEITVDLPDEPEEFSNVKYRFDLSLYFDRENYTGKEKFNYQGIITYKDGKTKKVKIPTDAEGYSTATIHLGEGDKFEAKNILPGTQCTVVQMDESSGLIVNGLDSVDVLTVVSKVLVDEQIVAAESIANSSSGAIVLPKGETAIEFVNELPPIDISIKGEKNVSITAGDSVGLEITTVLPIRGEFLKVESILPEGVTFADTTMTKITLGDDEFTPAEFRKALVQKEDVFSLELNNAYLDAYGGREMKINFDITASAKAGVNTGEEVEIKARYVADYLVEKTTDEAVTCKVILPRKASRKKAV